MRLSTLALPAAFALAGCAHQQTTLPALMAQTDKAAVAICNELTVPGQQNTSALDSGHFEMWTHTVRGWADADVMPGSNRSCTVAFRHATKVYCSAEGGQEFTATELTVSAGIEGVLGGRDAEAPFISWKLKVGDAGTISQTFWNPPAATTCQF